jgi:hypothetical protein
MNEEEETSSAKGSTKKTTSSTTPDFPEKSPMNAVEAPTPVFDLDQDYNNIM